MNQASRAVHAGRGDRAGTGGRRPLAPDLSTAAVHVYEDLDDYDAVARGEKPGHYYGRNSNSNRAMLEEAGDFKEKIALLFIIESVRSPEAVLLADSGQAERLAGKSAAENLVGAHL